MSAPLLLQDMARTMQSPACCPFGALRRASALPHGKTGRAGSGWMLSGEFRAQKGREASHKSHFFDALFSLSAFADLAPFVEAEVLACERGPCDFEHLRTLLAQQIGTGCAVGYGGCSRGPQPSDSKGGFSHMFGFIAMSVLGCMAHTHTHTHPGRERERETPENSEVGLVNIESGSLVRRLGVNGSCWHKVPPSIASETWARDDG